MRKVIFIGTVKVINTDGAISYEIPSGMTGAAFEKWKIKFAGRLKQVDWNDVQNTDLMVNVTGSAESSKIIDKVVEQATQVINITASNINSSHRIFESMINEGFSEIRDAIPSEANFRHLFGKFYVKA